MDKETGVKMEPENKLSRGPLARISDAKAMAQTLDVIAIERRLAHGATSVESSTSLIPRTQPVDLNSLTPEQCGLLGLRRSRPARRGY
jgi:hypothetical protein